VAAGDARLPVIAGAGQVTWRDGDPPPPLGLMTEAAHLAAADAERGGEALLGRAASVSVAESISWPVPDPGRELAAELGIQPRETVCSVRSGTSPIALLADACARIAAGELDVALLAGAESWTPFMRATREGRGTGWLQQPEGTQPDRLVGDHQDPSHPAELAAGLIAPITYYPLFESAVRSAAGHKPAEHTSWLGRLWGRFAAVAAGNEHAWARDGFDAEAIATPSPANRMVAEPYPKLMTANIQVDQGAALLVCSNEAAEAAGVPLERRVFVHAAAEAHDHWLAGEREALHHSPALAACGRAVLGHAGADVDDVSHLDLYSCFPSAVQVAGRELGIDLEHDDRPPTVTGGLTFAGGPGNDYCMHSLATMAGRLRGDGGELGLATGVGWYLTKHAVAVMSARPPAEPFRSFDLQDEVDSLPRREIAQDATTEAPVEAYTALYDREGVPTTAIVSALLEDGRRAFARSEDRAVIDGLLAGDPLGRPVRLAGARFEI
jgi:acetyl-CoA C-acetyltransferase